ncbi:ADP-ribosylglycohydrolase family protein [Calidifontibacter sp. DB0510]|uniref:ADP-ribosylglycohydrolase family protein n=1 Tax=Metallococcus carri TaxID=1656884 RepID=A0A967AXQ5_9MICO|nr:ADP-ribosylglycohydrolase family protein [Metallococcus carri]NHN54668.1 ADP-ribosylglycohydrolase family protein [Metallococcus carri]NOP37013.1 ADP-ribosylglycohydrolase family protein [Calidifontibacter sp. DB2511S]
MELTAAQRDRACGAVLGTAIGDALGAGYEFGSAPLGPEGPRMIGGGLGGFAPGEWTDDTSMAWCIAEVAARGVDLHSEAGLTEVARNFRAWHDSRPPDIGIQTARVLGAVGAEPTGASMTAAAEALHERTGRSAGNGSLMRTAAVCLPALDDPVAVAQAARAVSALTHTDPDAGDACVLWSLAIRHAIVNGDSDMRVGLEALPSTRRGRWAGLITEAETRAPEHFTPNGWVVTAFQAAWSSIVHTPVPEAVPCRQFADALAVAVGVGHDTDTVAAIAGALLGARWGASAVPAAWRRISHGYPGITGERLVELATLATGDAVRYGWPNVRRIDYSEPGSAMAPVRHPDDDGVWLSGVGGLDHLPADVTAVVSLCLVGGEQVPAGLEHVVFRLIDSPDEADNPNLDFVVADAAQTVADLRAEGHVVLLHCVAAQHRTPTIAIAYAVLRGVPLDQATTRVRAVLPQARPNRAFAAALTRFRHPS